MDRSADLWEQAEEAVRAVFSRPTSACPGFLRLIAYGQVDGEREEEGAGEERRAFLRHRVFCGHCARRFRKVRRLSQSLQRVGNEMGLPLRRLRAWASDEIGQQLLRELGEVLTQAIDRALVPRAALVTLGRKRSELQAQLLDTQGNIKEVSLEVEEDPEIRDGLLRLVVRLPPDLPAESEGQYEAQLALSLPESDLPWVLGRARIRKGRAALQVSVKELGVENEPLIPPSLLRVILSPRARPSTDRSRRGKGKEEAG